MNFENRSQTSPHRHTGRAFVRALVLATISAALALTANSCRVDPLNVVRPETAVAATPGGDLSHTDPTDPPTPEQAQVPQLTNVRAQIKGDALVLEGRIRPRSFTRMPVYDPYHAGGWALQLFVDSNPDVNPYWLGYEHLVRGVEWDPGHGTMVTRSITFEDGYPGGWGPSSGLADFHQSRLGFTLTVPLAALGGSVDHLNFALETYATVACDECDGGVTQDFTEDYFGDASTRGGRVNPADPSPASLRGIALATHHAALDLRLARLTAAR